jgi:hypothetical protein
MPTALSAEGKIKEFLRDTDIPASTFAALVPNGALSQERLSRALAGIKDLDANQSEAALLTLSRLNILITSLSPIPVNFKDVVVVRNILNLMESDRLHIDVRVDRDIWESAD